MESDKKWLDFEKVVAEMHRQIDPAADIKHNDKVRGKSFEKTKRKRQLDVAIRSKVGSYTVLIVIECKRLGRKVGISAVEAFSRKLKDIGANQGVMITNGTFSAGAKAIALEDGIYLRTVEEANETDWAQLGLVNTMRFFALKFIAEEGFAVIKDHKEPLAADLDATELFDIIDESIAVPLRDAIQHSIPRHALTQPGPAKFHLQLPVPVDTEINGAPEAITGFLVHGKVIAKRFEIPVALAESIMMSDGHTKLPIYGQVVTKGVDWREVESKLREEDGQDVTAEEYQELAKNAGLIMLNDDKLKYVRLNIKYNANPS